MTESHDIIDIGVDLAHRSFQPARQAIIRRVFVGSLVTDLAVGLSVSGGATAAFMHA